MFNNSIQYKAKLLEISNLKYLPHQIEMLKHNKLGLTLMVMARGGQIRRRNFFPSPETRHFDEIRAIQVTSRVR